MAFKITVDKDTCIGCGACEAVCDNFKLVGGKSNVIKPIVDELGCSKDAAEGCPVSAIKITKK